MPSSLSPADLLRRDREAAQRLAEKVGKQRALVILRGAQRELDRRLKHALERGPGEGSYTAVNARATLLQVKAVLAWLTPRLKAATLEQGGEQAGKTAESTLKYLRYAERHYRGSTARLNLDDAALFEAATRQGKASVLRRLMGEDSRRARGILDRYGEATVGHFERILQKHVVARTPPSEVFGELRASSPFLKQAPAYWTERIIRTEGMHGANAGAMETIEAAHEELGDMVKILSCTYDDRTGSDSIAVHGQIRRVSEVFDTWWGPCMHPPDRPNDRGVVVPHRESWPIPAGLQPYGAGAVAARWRLEGRKGAHPPIPRRSTIPLEKFGASNKPVQQKERMR